jgi:hypothetical protein
MLFCASKGRDWLKKKKKKRDNQSFDVEGK